MNERQHAPQERRDKEALRQSIIEGCQEMWDVLLETEREFHPLDEEVERLLQAEEACAENE